MHLKLAGTVPPHLFCHELADPWAVCNLNEGTRPAHALLTRPGFLLADKNVDNVDSCAPFKLDLPLNLMQTKHSDKVELRVDSKHYFFMNGSKWEPLTGSTVFENLNRPTGSWHWTDPCMATPSTIYPRDELGPSIRGC